MIYLYYQLIWSIILTSLLNDLELSFLCTNMCCLYNWWKQRHRIENERNFFDQYVGKSLLVGYWELLSLDDPIARNEPLDDEETFRTISSMARSGRVVLVIKRLAFDEDDEIWVICVSAPATEIVETKFRLGEEVDELTYFRSKATSVLTKPNFNKIVVRCKLKNGHVAEVTREVKPSDPNTLVGTIVVENNRAVATFKRVEDDAFKNVTENDGHSCCRPRPIKKKVQ